MKVASALENWEPSGHVGTFPKEAESSWESLEVSGVSTVGRVGCAQPPLKHPLFRHLASHWAGPAHQELSAALSFPCSEEIGADGWMFVTPSVWTCTCEGQ